MSRLLGIINPTVDPANENEYWFWRATGVIPAAAEWDYERLMIDQKPVADGNILFRVWGPPTELYRDGVFAHIHVNGSLNPQLKIGGLEAAPDPVAAIEPRAGMT